MLSVWSIREVCDSLYRQDEDSSTPRIIYIYDNFFVDTGRRRLPVTPCIGKTEIRRLRVSFIRRC
jgi:hypothetical protein